MVLTMTLPVGRLEQLKEVASLKVGHQLTDNNTLKNLVKNGKFDTGRYLFEKCDDHILHMITIYVKAELFLKKIDSINLLKNSPNLS